MSTSSTLTSDGSETGTELGNDVPSIDDTSSDDSGLSFGLSKRQIAVALGVVVVVSLLLWRLRSADSGSGAEEVEKARTEEIAGNLEYKDVDGDGDKEIVVPNNPDDELDKDAAVLDALKASGKMTGGE